jgi:hypothetical protein
MWQSIKQSQSPRETDDFWIEFHNLARDPNSHTRKLSFLGNRSPHIPGRGSAPPQATAGPYAHPMCRTYVYSATVWPYSRLLCRTYSHMLVRVNINQNLSGGGYVHLPGQSGTRLTAYHIYGMWLVLSNAWPPLPHTMALSNWSTQTGYHSKPWYCT